MIFTGGIFERKTGSDPNTVGKDARDQYGSEDSATERVYSGRIHLTQFHIQANCMILETENLMKITQVKHASI